MVGCHSPFGLIWQIAATTGWSKHHILWGLPYECLLRMLSDAPRYRSAPRGKKKPPGGRPGSNPRKAPDTLAQFMHLMPNT